MSTPEPSPNEKFAALLQLEKVVRQSDSLPSLLMHIVNDTGSILPYTQAFVLLRSGKKQFQTKAASNIPIVDRSSAMIQWLEQLVGDISPTIRNTVTLFMEKDVAEHLRPDWAKYCPPYMLWITLRSFSGEKGVILLTTSQPWSDQHLLLCEHLSEVFGHALAFFLPSSGMIRKRFLQAKFVALLLLVLLVFSLIVKIPLTTTAPVEIVPEQPHPVTAPFNGVVKEVVVNPNQNVQKDDLVVILDDTELRNQVEIARMGQKIAEEELERARRSAFADAESKAQMAELQAQVRRKEAEVAFARDRLEKTRILAQTSGLVIGQPKAEWEGRPVTTGMSIIQVADPKRVQARIFLPIADAITLARGSTIKIFLDNDPMHPLSAELEWASYSPEMAPMGFYAYRIQARLSAEGQIPRIGLRGTATLFGQKSSLFYSIFRKPITFVRQTIGL